MKRKKQVIHMVWGEISKHSQERLTRDTREMLSHRFKHSYIKTVRAILARIVYREA